MFFRTSVLAAVVVAAAIVGLQNTTEVRAQDSAARDNVVDGTLYPEGFTPVEIKNGK